MKKGILFGLAGLMAIVMMVSFIDADLTDAKEIIKKASENRFGETSYGVMKMQIVRPKWSRTIEMKNWSKGDDYSLVLITAPAKEKGQVFLKRKKEMWNWIPKISRMIKLPPSMMSQGWMGSDYSNDDIINQNSMVENYNHKIIGNEKVGEYDCYKIESIPKQDANIVWGKKINWVSKKGFFMMKSESYDEDGILVRTETASKVKTFGKRKLPSLFTIVPAEKKNNKTIFEIIDIQFNLKLEDSFFSQANMKRVK